MQDNDRPIRYLIFDASLRAGSLNDKLAPLATSVVDEPIEEFLV